MDLLVGTRKGLFVLRSQDRRSWDIEGPLLPGWEIMHAIRDPRDGTIYAASTTFTYGSTVHRSSDDGKTWQRSE
jgi:hypothetical protein